MKNNVYARLVVKCISGFVKHNNKLTVCPPGMMPSGNDRKNIVVASLKRSGTHILIDIILNNFSDYKNKPLYVDLDQYLWAGCELKNLMGVRGVVFKTHYPQISPPNFEKAMKYLAPNSIVLSPNRNITDVYLSHKKFEPSERSFTKVDVEYFFKYWRNYSAVDIAFRDMLSPEKCRDIVSIISHLTSSMPRSNIVFPPSSNNSLLWVYVLKLSTRLLGKYSPRINTTISFKVP